MLNTPSLILASAFLGLPASAQDASVAWPTPQAVTEHVAQLATGATAERLWIGTTPSGHALEALRFGPTDRHANHPAILVVGNVTGDRLAGTSVALGIAERLAAGGADVERLLDAATVYIIPSANPEAAALRFATPLIESTAVGHGRDTDRDGRIGEDAPKDINGDGLITWMRVPDPAGTLIPDPHDARLNVKADASRGERGLWKLLREGLDLDGDEAVAEDQPRDAEINKNFPAGFEAHTAAGGLYGGSESTTKALMDFILMHPELTLVVNLDAQDTLAAVPDASKGSRGRVPDGLLMGDDADVLKELSRRFTKLLPDAPQADSLVAGSWQRWLYEQRGILTLDSALWALPTKAEKDAKPDPGAASSEGALEELGYVEEEELLEELGYLQDAEIEDTNEVQVDAKLVVEEAAEKSWRKQGDEHKQLEWVDASGESWRFVDWQPFEHPTLGAVEIGGWAPYARVEPPAAALPGLVDGHFAFLVALADVMPRVEVTRFEATHLGKALWRIEARVENPAFLPLVTAAANRARTATRTRVDLYLPEGATVIVGQPVAFINTLDGLGQTGRDGELEWLVTTNDIDAVRIGVSTRNAGATEAAITRKETR